MKQLFVLGDTHFSTNKDWNFDSFSNFITWFESYDFGLFEDSELIQLGDVVEKASNLGDTLELVTKFFSIACTKFKKIYLIGGNHDHKMINDKSQYATQYLSFIGNNQVKKIFKEEILTTENGFNVIALPYRRVNGKVLDDYYSSDLPEEFYTTEADLICGHVALKEAKGFYGGIDIAKFATKFRAFGHIHIRKGQHKGSYTGSIMPFKVDEQDTDSPRAIKVYSRGKGISEREIEIPQFVKYDTVQFGDTPPHAKGEQISYVYTVSNCKNVQQAKTYYHDYYIRGIEKNINSADTKAGEKADIFLTPIAALETMLKETHSTIKRKTLALLRSVLS
jgi:calcineurin-like phosphoesterase family protein